MACPAAAVYVKNKNWGFWSRWGTKTATSWDPQKDWQVKWRVLIWVFVARVEQSYFFENTSVTIFPLFFCHSNMYRDRHRKPCWPLQASSQRRCPPRSSGSNGRFMANVRKRGMQDVRAHICEHTHNLKQFKNIFEIFTQAFFTPKKIHSFFFKFKVLRHEKNKTDQH